MKTFKINRDVAVYAARLPYYDYGGIWNPSYKIMVKNLDEWVFWNVKYNERQSNGYFASPFLNEHCNLCKIP